MATSFINNSSLLKALNLKIDSDKLESVVVPKEILQKANEKMKSYREVIKKNKHASLKNKIRGILGKEESKEETNRKKELYKAFLRAGARWLPEVAVYFKGCQGADTLEKYVKEIDETIVTSTTNLDSFVD